MRHNDILGFIPKEASNNWSMMHLYSIVILYPFAIPTLRISDTASLNLYGGQDLLICKFSLYFKASIFNSQ